jgi:hypothetical protein
VRRGSKHVDVKESELTEKTEAWEECRELRRSRKRQAVCLRVRQMIVAKRASLMAIEIVSV